MVLIPGLAAIAPWALFVAPFVHDFSGLYKAYATLINVSILALAVIVGAVIERVLTWQEVRWDRERDAELEVMENWYEYLAKQCDPEPVGFHYISRMATAMYFELAMMVATPIALLGTSVLLCVRVESSWSLISILTLVLMPLAWGFFYREAKCTHKVLCIARKELNERLKKRPPTGGTGGNDA